MRLAENHDRVGAANELGGRGGDDRHGLLFEIELDPLRAQQVDADNAVGPHVSAIQNGGVDGFLGAAGEPDIADARRLDVADSRQAVELRSIFRRKVQLVDEVVRDSAAVRAGVDQKLVRPRPGKPDRNRHSIIL